jgi:hypothetical protein
MEPADAEEASVSDTANTEDFIVKIKCLTHPRLTPDLLVIQRGKPWQLIGSRVGIENPLSSSKVTLTTACTIYVHTMRSSAVPGDRYVKDGRRESRHEQHLEQ